MPKPKLSQIIDIRDTEKSRYFAITEFNNCLIIRVLSCKSGRKKEKSTVSFMHEQNIICSQTLLDGIAHEKTIFCRQLFAGHVVDCRPMKRKKNLLRMIINFIKLLSLLLKRYFWLAYDFDESCW